MAAYADYEYYTTEYGGTAIPQAHFGNLALRATAKIDEYTLGRITEATEAIKNATCHVAEIMLQGDVTSESFADGSRSYGNKTMEQKCYEAAQMWLQRTGLLYAGVDVCSLF